MEDATEWLVSTDPLIVRRRVAWGECDPAGVVYTPRFAEYVVSAQDYWFRHALGHMDRPHPLRQQIVFPMRAMHFDFTGMIAPDEYFDMHVRLSEIRNRSLTLAINAVHERGHPVFTALLTKVAFDQKSGSAIAIPQPLRERLASLPVESETPNG